MTTEFFPTEPRSIEDTGLSMFFLSELALKTLYISGQMTGFELAQAMRLPFGGVVGSILNFLKKEHFCETKGAVGVGEGAYQYSITDRGGTKAREVLWRNQYAGPAPVPMALYQRAVRTQGGPRAEVSRDELAGALSSLVLSPDFVDEVGPALISRHSVLLHGPSGSGKTVVAHALARLLSRGAVYVPHAIEASGEIMLVYDDSLHVPADDEPAPEETGVRPDRRWVRVQRPVVTLGAALRLDALDPYFDELSRCYAAPPQVRANGGVVIMDDLGRQSTSATELLNRWMLPMDTRTDYLALRTGRKIEVPFEGVVIFATHLKPAELTDEATLRRIRHKVQMPNTGFEEFREIFRRAASARGVPYDERALAYLLQRYYIQPKRVLRASQPDEILSALVDIAQFRGQAPSLDSELVDRACRAYFGQAE
jgi:predicted ATPase with chaperone activity